MISEFASASSNRRGGTRRLATRVKASLVVLTLVAALGACSSDDSDSDSDSGATEADAALVAAEERADAAEAELSAAEESLAASEESVETLTADLDTATAANDELAASMETETARADTAEATLADIAELFPATVDSSIDGFDLIGAYTLSLTEAYCNSLSTCGQRRTDVRADIIQGPNGLVLQVPTVFNTGLFAIQGSLFGVTDSTLILAPCPGASERNARVSVTIFADGVTIAADGTKTLTGLGTSILVSGDAAGDCGAGVVFFAGNLTPV
jgi:hypothetical protein